MSSKHAAADGSPAASTLSLAHHRHSRRGSVASLSSTSQIDKETLSHTLDQINQHASHTGTLTTFNEYTSPPLPLANTDGKGLAGELHGGISGLYTRLRASVGNVREAVTHTVENGFVDDKSVKSPQLAPPSPASISRSKSHNPRNSNPSIAPVNAEDLTSSKTPTMKEGHGASPRIDNERGLKPTKLALGALSQAKTALTPNLPLKSPLAPPAPSTTLVSSAVAEAGVIDSRLNYITQPKVTALANPSSRAEDHLNETFQKQKSPFPEPSANLLSNAKTEEYSRTITEHTSEAVQQVKEESTSQEIGEWAPQQKDLLQNADYFTTTEQPPKPPKIVTHPGTPQTNHSRRSQAATTDSLEKRQMRVVTPSTPIMASPVSSQSSTKGHRSLGQKTDDASSSRATASHTNLKRYNLGGLSKGTAPQTKNRILSKDFWMKDENARDCFYCGDAFSTFRRKHHCSEYSYAFPYSVPCLRSYVT